MTAIIYYLHDCHMLRPLYAMNSWMRAVLPVLGEPMTTTLRAVTPGAPVSDSLVLADDSPEDALFVPEQPLSLCEPVVDLTNVRRRARAASLITSKSRSIEPGLVSDLIEDLSLDSFVVRPFRAVSLVGVEAGMFGKGVITHWQRTI
jgi:hypothetical protein